MEEIFANFNLESVVVVIGNDEVDDAIMVRLVIDAATELVVIPEVALEVALTLSGLIIAGTTGEIDLGALDRCLANFALTLFAVGSIVDDIDDLMLLDVVVKVVDIFDIGERDIFIFIEFLPCLPTRLVADLLTSIDEVVGVAVTVVAMEVVVDKLPFFILDTLIAGFDFCFFDDAIEFFSPVSNDNVDWMVETVLMLGLVDLLPIVAIDRLTTGFIICAIISLDVDTSAFCFDNFEVKACKEDDFDVLVRPRLLLLSSDVGWRLRFPRGAGSTTEPTFFWSVVTFEIFSLIALSNDGTIPTLSYFPLIPSSCLLSINDKAL